MNILIIGGLLGLAVVAILGAVLLGMGEDRSEKARKPLDKQHVSEPVLPSQPSQSRQETSPEPAISQNLASQAVPATPLLSRPTAPLPVSSAGETTGSFRRADLHGQVYEITSELRALAQRAGELQQRLIILGEALENDGQAHAEPSQRNSSADFFSSDTETQVF